MPGGKTSSVHLEKFPEAVVPAQWSAQDAAKWDKLLAVRGKVNEALEEQRKLKKIGKSLEARVQIKGGGLTVEDARLLEEVCLVSGVEVAGGAGGIEVAVFPADGALDMAALVQVFGPASRSWRVRKLEPSAACR
ncbi:MAG: hypothetical protein EB034_19035 [Verrucomicrobia bacterium]|nr:hypothetical protein [Verrucomicrobiota bacterium]